MSYKPSAGSLTSFVFPPRTIAVYQNVGICPNAVGANSLGTEFNGTFGSGKDRNRAPSANVPVGYTYKTFASGAPNDYSYGISNNTSINTGCNGNIIDGPVVSTSPGGIIKYFQGKTVLGLACAEGKSLFYPFACIQQISGSIIVDAIHVESNIGIHS